ncbi:hypothetical protein [Altericista sp. CCNU0014]|uniref:hypothetical protein n=1 Tax=Altericista sp. CCNU0014 TaxID=3082949 RepID=UPI00384BCE1E
MYKNLIHKVNYTVKNFIINPNNTIKFLLGRFYSVRLILTYFDRVHEAKESNLLQSFFPDLDISSAVSSLKKDGFFGGLALPQNILQEILDYTKSNDCHAGGDPQLGFRISDKKKVDQIYSQPFYMADYFNVSERCPAISKLANDSKLQEIAHLYVGKRAKYTGCSLTWVFPVEGLSHDAHRQESCSFHYDIDDYASMRVFFYLTEVTTEGAPHVFVYGSHHKKSLFHVLNFLSRKLADEAVSKFYGTEKVFPIYGPAGFGFIEDTSGFHKGTVPKSQLRLMLMLHYAGNNYNNEKYSDHRDPHLLKSFDRSKHLP